MKLNELCPADGATKKPKRVGRGFGSGHGKTATRGYNGQGQRSGESKKVGFEGGQMPLFRRTPKKHHFQRPERYLPKFAEINVGRIAEACSGDKPITIEVLAEVGLVPASRIPTEDGGFTMALHKGFDGVRVLGNGEIGKPLEIHATYFTRGAREKIEAAGGKAILLAGEGTSEE